MRHAHEGKKTRREREEEEKAKLCVLEEEEGRRGNKICLCTIAVYAIEAAAAACDDRGI